MLNEFQKRILQAAQMAAQQQSDLARMAPGLITDQQVYWYTHAPLTLNAATTGQATIPIQSDADFAQYYLSFTAINIATGLVVYSPYIRMQITDTNTGRTFFSEPALVSNCTGSSGQPYAMQNIKYWSRKSNVLMTYQNLDAAVNYSVQLILAGVKVFTK